MTIHVKNIQGCAIEYYSAIEQLSNVLVPNSVSRHYELLNKNYFHSLSKSLYIHNLTRKTSNVEVKFCSHNVTSKKITKVTIPFYNLN